MGDVTTVLRNLARMYPDDYAVLNEYIGRLESGIQSEKARADAAEAKVAALEAGMRGLVQGCCGAKPGHHYTSCNRVNRPADVEADRNG